MRVSQAVNNKSCCHREVTPDSKFPEFAVTKTILHNSDKYSPVYPHLSFNNDICTWVRKNGKCIIWGSILFTHQKVTPSSHKGFCKEYKYITHSPIWCCNPSKQLFQGHMVSHTIIKFQWFRWPPFIWLSLTAMTGYMSPQLWSCSFQSPHQIFSQRTQVPLHFREITRSASLLTAAFTRAATYPSP